MSTPLTFSPDEILLATNLVGDLASIQDLVDALDALWLTASGTSDTTLRVSFPTPPGPLTGTQTFRARVRKNAGGGGNPQVTMKLYENGTEIATLINSQSISGDTTIEGTWDATGRDPAKIECYIFGDAQGLLVLKRTLEIGAVEWAAELIDEALSCAILGTPLGTPFTTQVEMMNWVRLNASPIPGAPVGLSSNWYGLLWEIAQTP